ncbi:uncharacterized protein EV422DRAFT_96496 [Fimicolochytrium jonesii]|uniref:uncharacterized protein n=1 Tax=Fimicolochytrium jonesii TaxID=1396493 RepID=UPI0022FE0D63|nr:uncharacterized protein EV422DRAFT_96496 [Fimicolochytrium jonesii]KAI8819547.1 hypothetical protein EV422DRAFT_96496 [Fimicolochytrium jonesii]
MAESPATAATLLPGTAVVVTAGVDDIKAGGKPAGAPNAGGADAVLAANGGGQAPSTNPTTTGVAPAGTYEPTKPSYTQKAESKEAQRRVLAENREWNLSPVKKLRDLCVDVLVARFEEQPILSRIPGKYRDRVISGISVHLPLSITAPLVPDEAYWQRKSTAAFKICNLRDHGNSWRRLFFESHIQKLLEEYIPQPGSEKEAEVLAQLDLAAAYVHKLKLKQLCPTAYPVKKGDGPVGATKGGLGSLQKAVRDPSAVPQDHMNLAVVFAKLKHLEDIELAFSVRDCGIEFEWEYFGMTLNDCVSLTEGMKLSKLLRDLKVTASGIDNDRCQVLAAALVDNKTLQSLDLSHNIIGDTGAQALATVLVKPKCRLTRLSLCNNHIKNQGGAYLANALTRNSSLISLALRMNFFGDKGSAALFTALKDNKTLQHLDLSCNQMGPATVGPVCTALKNNIRSLVSLDLSCNRLGNADHSKDGTRLVGVEPARQTQAQAQPNAKAMGDTHGGIEDAAGRALFDAVSQNKYVTQLDLRLSGITSEFQVAIQGIINENKAAFA